PTNALGPGSFTTYLSPLKNRNDNYSCGHTSTVIFYRLAITGKVSVLLSRLGIPDDADQCSGACRSKYAEVVQDIAFCGLVCGLRIYFRAVHHAPFSLLHISWECTVRHLLFDDPGTIR